MTASLKEILLKLEEHDVEFILVGGMAAVLHGAPIATQDIDVVHRRDHETVTRLLEMLAEVNARYRGQPRGRVLRPTRQALTGSGHNNLMTDLGPLDLLGELAPGQGYEQLLPHAQEMSDGSSSLKVIGLEKLIEIKTETGRPKDRLVLPILMKLLGR